MCVSLIAIYTCYITAYLHSAALVLQQFGAASMPSKWCSQSDVQPLFCCHVFLWGVQRRKATQADSNQLCCCCEITLRHCQLITCVLFTTTNVLKSFPLAAMCLQEVQRRKAALAESDRLRSFGVITL
jgi:hypothetical protein